MPSSLWEPPPLLKPWFVHSFCFSLSAASVLHSAYCAPATAPGAGLTALPSPAAQLSSEALGSLQSRPDCSAFNPPLLLCAQVALPSPHPRILCPSPPSSPCICSTAVPQPSFFQPNSLLSLSQSPHSSSEQRRGTRQTSVQIPTPPFPSYVSISLSLGFPLYQKGT